MTTKLAIVIPAYKGTYLRATLDSIAAQSCTDFTVYIGDDASPYYLNLIVEEYKSKLDIRYKKFDQNLGAYNLVSQWERCINLISDEEWIWLFSDDDIMENNCVQNFYSLINNDFFEHDIIHYNTCIINQLGQIISYGKKFPNIISTSEYFKMILKGGYYTFVVDYIFKKEKYLEDGRFTNFPLAWGSDTATWMKIGSNKGIYTIDDCYVLWRYSGENISSINNIKDIIIKKINSDLEFFSWSLKYFEQNKIIDLSTKIDKMFWIIRQLKNKDLLSLKEKNIFINKFLTSAKLNRYYFVFMILFFVVKIKNTVYKKE